MATAAVAVGTKTPTIGTCTISIATPAVVTITNQLSAGDKVKFATTGALPTGLAPDTWYYVLATNLSTASFKLAATLGGSPINTTGSQSGAHRISDVDHILSSVAAAGVTQLYADLAALDYGDRIELSCYQIVITAGTPRRVQFTTYNGPVNVDKQLVVSPPIGNELTDATAVQYRLRYRMGTPRAIPWKVLRIAA